MDEDELELDVVAPLDEDDVVLEAELDVELETDVDPEVDAAPPLDDAELAAPPVPGMVPPLPPASCEVLPASQLTAAMSTRLAARAPDIVDTSRMKPP
ncbi:Hypothetical protein A7982_03334 [Minicystis rosea]|nr:Hypothetical protein A7982_03334 [Minicystis rosea]